MYLCIQRGLLLLDSTFREMHFLASSSRGYPRLFLKIRAALHSFLVLLFFPPHHQTRWFLVAEKVHTTLWRLLRSNTAYYIYKWTEYKSFLFTSNAPGVIMVKKVITKTFWQQITTFCISHNRQSFKIYSG